MTLSEKKRADLREQLQPILLEGETILDLTTGLAHVTRLGQETVRRGTLFVSDRRLGVFTKKLGGHELLDFAYGLVTSVEYRTGLMFGDITLLAAGERTEIQEIEKSEVERIAQAIRNQVAMASAPAPQPSNGPSMPGISDELTKLAQLRASGILTDSEFAEQKARLLNS